MVNFMNKYKLILSWILVILWMIVIFNLSAQPVTQSNNLSKSVAKVVVETAEKAIPKVELDINKTNHLLRKYAHFFSYLVLGVLVTNAIKLNKAKGFKLVLVALSICVVYAISDEVHQIFVPGRGGQIRDVIIDSFGAVVGVMFTYYFQNCFHKKHSEKFV